MCYPGWLVFLGSHSLVVIGEQPSREARGAWKVFQEDNPWTIWIQPGGEERWQVFQEEELWWPRQGNMKENGVFSKVKAAGWLFIGKCRNGGIISPEETHYRLCWRWGGKWGGCDCNLVSNSRPGLQLQRKEGGIELWKYHTFFLPTTDTGLRHYRKA